MNSKKYGWGGSKIAISRTAVFCVLLLLVPLLHAEFAPRTDGGQKELWDRARKLEKVVASTDAGFITFNDREALAAVYMLLGQTEKADIVIRKADAKLRTARHIMYLNVLEGYYSSWEQEERTLALYRALLLNPRLESQDREKVLGKPEALAKKLKTDAKIPEAYTRKTSEAKMSLAAKNGDVELIKSLAQSGVSVNGRNEKGMAPIHWAARRGDLALVRWLVEEKKVAPDTIVNGCKGGCKLTALHFASASAVNPSLFAIYPEYGKVTQDMRDKAARALEVITYLLGKGADVNARRVCRQDGYWGRTPLFMAAEAGDLEMVKLFLAKGGKMEFSRDSNDSVLGMVVMNGCTEVCDYLIKRGARVDSVTDGSTLLHACATKKSNAQVLDLLLSTKKIDVQAKQKQGLTALAVAKHLGTLDRFLPIYKKHGLPIQESTSPKPTPKPKVVKAREAYDGLELFVTPVWETGRGKQALRRDWTAKIQDWHKTAIVSTSNIPRERIGYNSGALGDFAQSFVAKGDRISAVGLAVGLGEALDWVRVDVCADNNGRPARAALSRTWLMNAGLCMEMPRISTFKVRIPDVAVEDGKTYWIRFASCRQQSSHTMLKTSNLDSRGAYIRGDGLNPRYRPKTDANVLFEIISDCRELPGFRELNDAEMATAKEELGLQGGGDAAKEAPKSKAKPEPKSGGNSAWIPLQ